MFFDVGGVRLNAKLELPDNEAVKSPLLIISHGFTGNMEEPHILAAAEAAREAGFAVLRVELYGHGRSGGSFRDHDIRKWVDELTAIIDRVRRLDFVSELWLCGHSQGGLAVMLAAAERKEAVKGLIPLSPAWMIPAGARMGVVLGNRFDPDKIPDEIPLGDGLTLGGSYLRVAQSIEVEPAIRAFDGPVLIVHGTADETVPYAFAQQAAALYKDCTLIPIEGDTHCFDLHCDRMQAALRAWLEARMWA
ncbi:MAG: alpha/beta fold hydrolase [Oscillospiraceae bacterium]|nr:alpha/beta fold hydrolase [Oscillospiraceae bacterium]